MAKVIAPFTPEQVVYLEMWQAGIGIHPFTCCSHDGCVRAEQANAGELIPSIDGWVCPCGQWKQDWCHDFMCSPRTYAAISSRVQCALAEQWLKIIQEMLQDWWTSKLITETHSVHARDRVLAQELHNLKSLIDHYEFSHAGDPRSSKEDPSSTEGNAG